jgi:hypothetical protein
MLEIKYQEHVPGGFAEHGARKNPGPSATIIQFLSGALREPGLITAQCRRQG